MKDVDIELLERNDLLTEDARSVLRERALLWIRAECHRETRAAVIKMCREGDAYVKPYIYFARMFAWIFEPRNPFGFKKLPFVPFAYQERELDLMHHCVTVGEGMAGDPTLTLWLKSRDMGLTWLVILYFAWHALFHMGHFHCGSRNESEVDTKTDVKCIFFKIRYLINNLPPWMLEALCPDKEDKHLLVAWNGGESGITGESANEEFATGNRQTGILADEYSKWENDRSAYRSMREASNCIFLVGTPKGYGNYYSEIANGKTDMEVEVRRVHWVEHPIKNIGLEYINGKPTSEWYRKKCARMEEDMIAGELDLRFEGSLKGLVFGSLYNREHQRENLRPIPGIPIIRGWDPGGWAGAIWFQIDRYGRKRVYRELITQGASLTEFCEQLIAISKELEQYGCEIIDANGRKIRRPGAAKDWFSWEDFGDPSGASSSKMNQDVPEYTEVFDKFGISIDYLFMAHLPTEIRRRARIVAIERALTKPIVAGDEPGFGLWVDVKQCKVFDEALRGGYRRKLDKEGRVMEAIEERHPYNEAIDAFGYGLVGKEGVPDSVRQETRKQRSREEVEDEDAREWEPRRERC